MTPGLEVDADRIAAAVLAVPLIAGMDSGRFGEIATYLPGRRVPGVRIRPDGITLGVVGRYPATIPEIAAAVRAAVEGLNRPVHVTVMDLVIPEKGSAATPGPQPRQAHALASRSAG